MPNPTTEGRHEVQSEISNPTTEGRHEVKSETPIYAADFTTPAALDDFVLEGGRGMSVADGKLILESDPDNPRNHLVAWLKHEMPADFLLEFTVRPQNRKNGLNIVFFNTRGVGGQSIFDPSLQPRDGFFPLYHSGDLNGYHISYWAGDRGTANVRKNKGFHLVASGPDLVRDAPADAFQTIRIHKHGGDIRLTVDDALSIAYHDDGQTHGPVHTHPGWIGLRQMAHTIRCEYRSLRVWPVH